MTPPRGHPLNAARFEQALISGAVTMKHASRQHIGDGLKAPMWVVWKSGDIIAGIIASESVQHQERIKSALKGVRQDPGELDAGPVGGLLTRNESLNPS